MPLWVIALLVVPGSNQGTIIVKLKPFEERPGGFFHRIKEACTGGGIEALFVNPMEYTSVLGMIYKQTAAIKDAQVLAFAPPMIVRFLCTEWYHHDHAG